MVSPELLKRYPFFGSLSQSQLKAIASLAEEQHLKEGTEIFEECAEATTLYLLIEGGIDLYYRSQEEYHPKSMKEFHVDQINPGEVFGISALIEPYALNATARASQECRVIAFDATAMRALFTEDVPLAYNIMTQVAKTVMERLGYARVQLAAAWADKTGV